MSVITPELKAALSTPWDLCTEAQKELRRVNFGSHNSKAAWDGRRREIVRRYFAGEYLTKADKREARAALSHIDLHPFPFTKAGDA